MNKKLLVLILSIILIVGFNQFTLAQTEITWRMGSWWEVAAPIAVEKFEKENPDIAVKIELVPWKSWTQQAILSAMSQKPPDVMMLTTPLGEMWNMADKGLLEALDPYIEKSGIDPNDFYAPAWSMGNFRNKQFGIPYRANPFALFYNVEMFKEADLDPNNPPKTYEEILYAAKKMTNREDGKYGFAIPASSVTSNQVFQSASYFSFIFGGNILNKDWTKAIINSPESKAGIKFWSDLYLEEKVVPEGLFANDSNDIAKIFGTGSIGMFIYGIESYSLIAETAAEDFEYKVSQLPGLEVQAYFLGIPKNSQNKEAAWRFIKWFTDPKNLPEVAIRLPAVKSAAIHPKWGIPKNEPFFKSLDSGRVAYPPQIPEWTEITDIVVQQLQAILMQKSSVDEGMDEAARLIDELLK